MFARLQEFLAKLSSFSENKPADKFSGIKMLDEETLTNIKTNSSNKSFKLRPEYIYITLSRNNVTAYYQDSHEIKSSDNLVFNASQHLDVINELTKIKKGDVSYRQDLLETITDVIFPVKKDNQNIANDKNKKKQNDQEHVIEMPDVRSPKPLKYYLNRLTDMLSNAINYNKKPEKSSTEEGPSSKLDEDYIPPSKGPGKVYIEITTSPKNIITAQKATAVKKEEKPVSKPSRFSKWFFSGSSSKTETMKEVKPKLPKFHVGFSRPALVNHSLFLDKNKKEYDKFSKTNPTGDKKYIKMLGPAYYGIKFKI